mmetsp:Transcript_804/g.1494  ORF Transcript_804/g.1494 Transcript_804/m.1494 type:complete len:374 (-) Transcript_804:552-1673(-)
MMEFMNNSNDNNNEWERRVRARKASSDTEEYCGLQNTHKSNHANGLISVSNLFEKLPDAIISTIYETLDAKSYVYLRTIDKFMFHLMPDNAPAILKLLRNQDQNNTPNVNETLHSLRNLVMHSNPSIEITDHVKIYLVLTKKFILDLQFQKIPDLSPLSSLVHLVQLHISDKNITDFSPLSNLINLTHLSLPHTQISQHIPVLYPLFNLKELNLRNTQISDLSSLSRLTHLTSLNLNQNKELTQLTPLSSLTELQSLRLAHTQVTDICPLSTLDKLSNLYLNHTPVSDISVISLLKNLKHLSLHHTNVTDCDAITELSKLKWMYIDTMQLEDVAEILWSEIIRLQVLYIYKINDSDPFILQEFKRRRMTITGF